MKSKTKVAIVATHPIQYQIPWFKLLTEQGNVDLKVYYALLPDQAQQGIGFGVPFQWDIPILEGYAWEVLPNKAKSPSLRGFFNSNISGIRKTFERDRPAAVVITGWQSLPLLQALWACIRLKIPRIMRGESNSMRKRKMWVRFAHQLLLSQYNAFLAIGKANSELYLNYGIQPEKIFACHYFVDNQRFQNQSRGLSSERESIRTGWGIDPKQTCFLYVAKLEPKKRIMDLLQALDRTRRLNPDIFLLVVGMGKLQEQARRFVEEQKLPVTFAGFLNQTEIAKAYVAGDCLVLPSDYGETWGLVVNEAMACGLPAIVSNRVGCGPDLVENGITGYTFPFGDVDALAEKLVAVASDKENRLIMGKNAKERIKGYSVENAVEGTLKAINYVVKERSALTTP